MEGRRSRIICVVLTALFSWSALCVSALADVYVKGHYRGGKWIAPHHRSSPNYTVTDNWSYKGNVNPYTGEIGTNAYSSGRSNSVGRSSFSGRYGGAIGPGTGAASTAGAVHVDGYYRKDGTYVQPHYRSRPDGNFNNNWSTKPNVNPFTGEMGTRVTPPGGTSRINYAPIGQLGDMDLGIEAPEAADLEVPAPEPVPPRVDYKAREQRRQEHREHLAVDLLGEGVTVDPTVETPFEMGNKLLRLRLAKELKERDIIVFWDQYTAGELIDIKLRSSLASELGVDWHAYTLEELYDIQTRIGLAHYLRNRGRIVNWRKHTVEELSRMSVEP
jgi:hypothetical protein